MTQTLRRRTSLRGCAALLTLACVGAAGAQEAGAASGQRTGAAAAHAAAGSVLRQAFEAAWAVQPEAQAQALRRDAVDAALQAARRWTPQAPVLELAGRSDRGQRHAAGAREVEAALAVSLWWPGERRRAEQAAQADVDGLASRLALARWRLAEQVRQAWWDRARAALEQGLARKRLQSARELAADVARRHAAGDLARVDRHQAEAAVAAAEGAAAEADALANRAAGHWRAVIAADGADAAGSTRGHEASVAEAMPPAEMAIDAAMDVDVATDVDVSTGTGTGTPHPILNDLATQAEAARRRRALAEAAMGSNPELTIGTVREREAHGERASQRAMVGLRIPLGRDSGQPARVATAAAEEREALAQRALEARRIAAEVAAARQAVLALDHAAQAAERRSRLATGARGFLEQAFRLGEADLPARLRIELEAFEAERGAARARLEHAAAISRLRQALGLLPE